MSQLGQALGLLAFVALIAAMVYLLVEEKKKIAKENKRRADLIKADEDYYKKKTYTYTYLSIPNGKVYKNLAFDYNKKYIIHGIGANIYYKDNIEDCFKRKDELVAELTERFKKAKVKDHGTYKHSYDKSGKSTVTSISFYLKKRKEISITCKNWSKDQPYDDNLEIFYVTKKFQNFLNTAY